LGRVDVHTAISSRRLKAVLLPHVHADLQKPSFVNQRRNKIMTFRKSALVFALVTVTPFTSSASENGTDQRQSPSAHDTILVDEMTTSVNATGHTNPQKEHPRQPTSRDNREINDDER
jgi:hypothetical protein